jgi:hypothetical protein
MQPAKRQGTCHSSPAAALAVQVAGPPPARKAIHLPASDAPR